MFVLLLLLTAIPGLFIPKFVLGCVYEAEQRNQHPTQFLMTDTMWLIIIVQMFWAPLGLYWHPLDMIPFYVFTSIGLPLVWWHSVRVLSRAGVMSFWHRGIFLFVAPLTLALTITTIACGMAFAMAAWEGSGRIMQIAGCIFAGSVVLAISLRFGANYVVKPLPLTPQTAEPAP